MTSGVESRSDAVAAASASADPTLKSFLEAVRCRFAAQASGIISPRQNLWTGEESSILAPNIQNSILAQGLASNDPFLWHGGLARDQWLFAVALPESVERHVLCLAGVGPRSFTSNDYELLKGDAGVASLLLAQQRQIAELTRRNREQSGRLAHARKLFDRASEVARIGVWECALPSEELTWTDVVYDLFDLPRGSALSRQKILPLYSPESLVELERRRSAAIANRSGFTLDAMITTAKGNVRWIRLTATVECEGDVPVRIFGMKQDITEEKLLAERTRYLAEIDPLTGLANRTVFQSRLCEAEENASRNEGRLALLLVDLDGFKLVNDSAGHAAGDECLRLTATRLARACVGAELVARIGGDEFAVLSNCDHVSIEKLARKIVRDLRRPICLADQIFHLGGSIGIAFFETAEGADGANLFVRADAALYAAKSAGKNTYRFFGREMAGWSGRGLLPDVSALGRVA